MTLIAKKTADLKHSFIIIGDGEIIPVSLKDNISWLPLFYLIPKEFFEKCKVLYGISRKPYEVLRTDHYNDLINDDTFLEFIWDVTAYVAWQFIKVQRKDGTYRDIPGKMSCYSGDSIVWRTVYMLTGALRNKLEQIGWSFQWLYSLSEDEELPWLSYENFGAILQKLVPEIITEQGWQPMIDASWEYKAEEDYDDRYSYPKEDFNREWNHSRAKVKVINLQDYLDENAKEGECLDIDSLMALKDPSMEFETRIIDQKMMQPFMDSLSRKDLQMLQMKADGYTLQEIADAVGYKTHSAVKKRIKALGNHYTMFVNDAYRDFLDSH